MKEYEDRITHLQTLVKKTTTVSAPPMIDWTSLQKAEKASTSKCNSQAYTLENGLNMTEKFLQENYSHIQPEKFNPNLNSSQTPGACYEKN